MKRSAILIHSPLSTFRSDHLDGPSEDVMNKEKLLLSANGGGWLKDELIILPPNPSAWEIKRALDFQSKADFAMTYFSGHGFQTNGKSHLVINDNEAIFFKDLFVSTKWNLVMMDACRKDYPYSHAEGIHGLPLEFEHCHSFCSRIIYEKAIEATPHGKAVIFSTSEDEYSHDSKNGGAYTLESISQTINWINTNTEIYLQLGTIFNSISRGLQSYIEPQFPQLKCTCQGMLRLPFATNPKILFNNPHKLLYNPISPNKNNIGKKMSIRVLS